MPHRFCFPNLGAAERYHTALGESKGRRGVGTSVFAGLTLIEEATMFTVPTVSTDDRLEMVRLFGHGWVITDTSYPHDDPRCLIAYVERHAEGFEVVWVQAPMGTAYFPTKQDALAAAAHRASGLSVAA
jgi:hypothetical protein